ATKPEMPGLIQTVVVAVAAIFVVFYSGNAPVVLRKLTEFVHGKPGCAPAPDLGNVTIHYFDIRGRGEAIRLMLEQAEIPYTEVSFNGDTWPAQKQKGMASGLYTFGQVPAIETASGSRLVQSIPIVRYIGRATGISCDCDEMAQCEVIAHGAEDVRAKYGKMVYNPDFTLADREEYLTVTLPLWLGYFEKLAPTSQQGKDIFFASSRLTWVDFLVFDLLDVNVEFGKFNVGANVAPVDPLKDFPKLAKDAHLNYHTCPNSIEEHQYNPIEQCPVHR
ncbi:unnamed protein product, partial [Owenia fusiformis]